MAERKGQRVAGTESTLMVPGTAYSCYGFDDIQIHVITLALNGGTVQPFVSPSNVTDVWCAGAAAITSTGVKVVAPPAMRIRLAITGNPTVVAYLVCEKR